MAALFAAALAQAAESPAAPSPASQTTDPPPIAPLVFEAESGDIGVEFRRVDRQGLQYVTTTTDLAGNAPARSARVLTYQVTFAAPGDYDLYAKIRVGKGDVNDDSCFIPAGFGRKDPAQPSDWVLANGLGSAGYSRPNDVVGAGGRPAPGAWNWVNLSRFVRAPNRLAFVVAPGQLVQTLQIGAREDGLEIDRFAFAPAGISHTVRQMERRLPGKFIPLPPPPPPFTPTGPALAAGQDKFLGGVYSPAQIANFTAYFNQVTPENAGKWGSIEAKRDVMVWDEADRAHAFARQHGLPFKWHVMIWGNQQPSWIEALSPREQREEIEEWFKEVAKRYPELDYVEIVNEPLHDPPDKSGDGGGNYLAALGGAGKTGWDWIVESFRLGRKYFPKSQLMLNDYSILNTPSDTARYKGIIELLQKEKLIDAVGVQGHAFSTNGPLETQAAGLDALASTGLPLFITELDIDGSEDAVQLAEYQRIFPLFWEHPAVAGITLWGYRPGMWRTAQGAYLAYENGAERPALVWLRQYLKTHQPKLAKPPRAQRSNKTQH